MHKKTPKTIQLPFMGHPVQFNSIVCSDRMYDAGTPKCSEKKTFWCPDLVNKFKVLNFQGTLGSSSISIVNTFSLHTL